MTELQDRLIARFDAMPPQMQIAARHLIDKGYLSVRPLRGGYEAWLAAVGKESPAK